ncbi:MAG: winged helix-turn-helix transcriptional regulator [Candidatus Omnitrophica bacterium]|nr:winged helix-turn-helix transcriptional regulator [Candidatus Omnitrophota bacterium]
MDEREFELINIIGADLGSNQRELSRLLDLSLGQTNMLIRRLVTKGYIRISQLDKRKVQYLLTPKGFAEKMQKSIKYTIKTINSISLIKNKIKQAISRIYDKGERRFFIFGKSDLAMLIEMVLKEMSLKDYSLNFIEDIPTQKLDGALLICKENIAVDKSLANDIVDFIHELASDSNFLDHTKNGLEASYKS